MREGINAFLSGYLPTANLRFREHALSFHSEAVDPAAAEPARAYKPTPYPAMAKALDGFRLRVEPGSFAPSEVIVLLGRNGTGEPRRRRRRRPRRPTSARRNVPPPQPSPRPQLPCRPQRVPAP